MSMNKVIAGAVGILVVLIIITLILTSFTSKKESQNVNPTLIPTTTLNFKANPMSSPENQRKNQELVQKEGNVFEEEEISEIDEFNNKLPHSTDSFSIARSDGLGEYYIQEKTEEADEDLDSYLQENNVQDLRDNFDYLFTETDKPPLAAIVFEEDKMVKARLLQSEDPEIPEQEKRRDDEQLFIDTMKTLLDFKLGDGGGTGGNLALIVNPTELDKIFNEAGTKVNTPPKMLKAIMSIECGRLISITPARDILTWSAPGATGLPSSHYCYRNRSGYPAFGPMQFVTGTFARYGPAVNRYGGYSHRPSIQNIRDSVFAAAEHFKLNSGATGPNWTAEQIKRAYVCYAAGCRQYDSKRIGSDTQRLYERFLANYNSY